MKFMNTLKISTALAGTFLMAGAVLSGTVANAAPQVSCGPPGSNECICAMTRTVTTTAAGSSSSTFTGIIAPLALASENGCCAVGPCQARSCTFHQSVTICWTGNVTWGLQYNDSPLIRQTGGTSEQAMNFSAGCGASEGNQNFGVYSSDGTLMASLALSCSNCPAQAGE